MPTSPLQTIPGTIVPGHQVASGQGGDPRFPGGTLAWQEPVFRSLGLDLAAYHRGTLNLAIAPWRYQVQDPLHCFRSVRWHPTAPPEDFSFFDCRLLIQGQGVAALVYYPHPDTKPEHFQAADVLEILCPYVAGVRYGMTVDLVIDRRRIQFQR
ncbi:MAG: hypothetical protein ACO331_12535 [Prochlorothrix sp.]